MKPFLRIAAAVLLTVSGSYAQEKFPAIAFISKVVKDVERRDSATGNWIKAMPASELRIGCEVRTLEESSVLVQFSDGSKVAVRSQSALRVIGDESRGKTADRGLFIERGRVIFNLKDQRPGVFHVTSPVSAASIRKGEGGFSFDPATSRAELTVGSAEAEFSSTRVDCRLIVRAGHTAVIDSTGCRSR